MRDLDITKDGKIGAGFSGLTTSGHAYATQLFTTILMTQLGSRQGAPTFGTTFVEALRNGVIRTQLDVTAQFDVAWQDISEILAEIQPEATTPDDERIVDAQLTDFTLDQGNVMLYIQLRTADQSEQTVTTTLQ